jgi:uncharacterized membrane-anchored protein YhcB (DUF1043 family)
MNEKILKIVCVTVVILGLLLLSNIIGLKNEIAELQSQFQQTKSDLAQSQSQLEENRAEIANLQNLTNFIPQIQSSLPTNSAELVSKLIDHDYKQPGDNQYLIQYDNSKVSNYFDNQTLARPMPIIARFQYGKNDPSGRHRYSLIVVNNSEKPLKIEVVVSNPKDPSDPSETFSKTLEAGPTLDMWYLNGLYDDHRIKITSEDYDPVWLRPFATIKQWNGSQYIETVLP